MSQYSSTTGKEKEVAVKLFLMNNILIVYLRKWELWQCQLKKIPSATIVKKAWDSTDDNILG